MMSKNHSEPGSHEDGGGFSRQEVRVFEMMEKEIGGQKCICLTLFLDEVMIPAELEQLAKEVSFPASPVFPLKLKPITGQPGLYLLTIPQGEVSPENAREYEERELRNYCEIMEYQVSLEKRKHKKGRKNR
jgi:hypothetical protein